MDQLAQKGLQRIHESQFEDQKAGDQAEVHDPEAELLQTKLVNIRQSIQTLFLQIEENGSQGFLLRLRQFC